MKTQFWAGVLVLVYGQSVALLAQGGGRLGQMHAPAGQSEQLPPEVRVGASLRTVTLMVTVVPEDGATLDTAPLVLESRLDPVACRVSNVFRNGGVRLEVPDSKEDPAEHDARGFSCYLSKVMLPGYRSFSGLVRDGTVISLHRLGEHEGSTVSITSLSAPEPARKAYQKGEAALHRHKWAEARRQFERATDLYNGYAVAWSELGVALEQQSLFVEADAAWRRSSAADPRYIRPLVQRAALAGKQQRWLDQFDSAGRALRLHAVEFPGAYLSYAEATYHLGRLQEAETACRGAIQADQAREFPRAHFLLASILDKKGERSRAAEEFREFLRHTPEGDEAETARRQLAEMER